MLLDSPGLVDVVETPAEAAQLAVPPLIVRSTLARALPGAGPISVKRIGYGHSNATFEVQRGESRWILRRPPRSPYERRAHDVLREHRLLVALATSTVPVPKPVLVCDDVALIGAPFYLMDAVDGVVIRERIPASFSHDGNLNVLAYEMVDALVELHGVDWREVGLDRLAPHSGYLERQLRIWAGQFARTTLRLHALHETEALLRERVPVSRETTIVHGDYKMDNLIWATEARPRVLAIVDWEMATLGDPLTDIGFLTAMWSGSGDPERLLLGLAPAIPSGVQVPASVDLASRYAERSGRDLERLAWYQAFGIWKLTVLLEVSFGRHLSGTTDDPFFEVLGDGLPRLAEHALELAHLA
jgi:aminoglycoside phosphotransferase (APT) family kinase protein